MCRTTAAMGATFALTDSVVANMREKDDALNGVAGGCAAGFLAGIRGASTAIWLGITQFLSLPYSLARSIPMAVASCAVLGAAVGTFDYGGKAIAGSVIPETQEEKRRRFFKHPQPSPFQPPSEISE